MDGGRGRGATSEEITPTQYGSAIIPPTVSESWVKLKLVIEGKQVAAYVNGANKPALSIELLNERSNGKLGLWLGNGSNRWFKNLKLTPAGEMRMLYAAVQPPSSVTTDPCINEAAGEEINSASAATSSGLPRRPIGCLSFSSARTFSFSCR